jgi:heme/copper-type cytochrome/quinol oxidase subunit 2
MSKTTKVVGKLSLWGLIVAFLLWLGQKLLEYLWVIISPWLHWLMGWLMLIAGLLAVCAVLLVGISGYMAVRAWRRRRQEKKADAKA